MATVQHPEFEKVTLTVDNPEEWVEQGWRPIDDPPADPTETGDEEARPRRRRSN